MNKEDKAVLKAITQNMVAFRKKFDTAFNKFKRSDNIIKVEGGYTTQCTQYGKIFTESELSDYFRKQYYLV